MNKGPGQIWQDGLIYIAEKITNACLSLDPATRERLRGLDGKCIAFHLRDQVLFYPQGIKVFVHPTQHGIALSADTASVADAAVMLFARDLLPLFKEANIPETLLVEGDEMLLLAVLDILKQLDLDWESLLSSYTGPVIAHGVGQRVRNTGAWAANTYTETRRLFDEYMEEELPVARQAPPFKPFFEGLEQLKSMGAAVISGWRKK